MRREHVNSVGLWGASLSVQVYHTSQDSRTVPGIWWLGSPLVQQIYRRLILSPLKNLDSGSSVVTRSPERLVRSARTFGDIRTLLPNAADIVFGSVDGSFPCRQTHPPVPCWWGLSPSRSPRHHSCANNRVSMAPGSLRICSYTYCASLSAVLYAAKYVTVPMMRSR